jgi:hypothetical protein
MKLPAVPLEAGLGIPGKANNFGPKVLFIGKAGQCVKSDGSVSPLAGLPVKKSYW